MNITYPYWSIASCAFNSVSESTAGSYCCSWYSSIGAGWIFATSSMVQENCWVSYNIIHNMHYSWSVLIIMVRCWDVQFHCWIMTQFCGKLGGLPHFHKNKVFIFDKEMIEPCKKIWVHHPTLTSYKPKIFLILDICAYLITKNEKSVLVHNSNTYN